MAVRLGLLLSALTGLVVVLLGVWTLIASPEWGLVILIYVAFSAVVALAWIWLGVFVVNVVRKAVRVMKHGGQN